MDKKIKKVQKQTIKVEKGLKGLLKQDKRMDKEIDSCRGMKKKMKKGM